MLATIIAMVAAVLVFLRNSATGIKITAPSMHIIPIFKCLVIKQISHKATIFDSKTLTLQP